MQNFFPGIFQYLCWQPSDPHNPAMFLCCSWDCFLKSRAFLGPHFEQQMVEGWDSTQRRPCMLLCPYGLLWVSAFFCYKRHDTELRQPRVWLSLTTGVVRVPNELWTGPHPGNGSSTSGTVVVPLSQSNDIKISDSLRLSVFVISHTHTHKKNKKKALNHSLYSLFYFGFIGPTIFMILIFSLLLDERQQAS